MITINTSDAIFEKIKDVYWENRTTFKDLLTSDLNLDASKKKFEKWLKKFGGRIEHTSKNQKLTLIDKMMGRGGIDMSTGINLIEDKIVFDRDEDLTIFLLRH